MRIIFEPWLETALRKLLIMHFPSAAGYDILDHGEQQNTESREQSYTNAYNVALYRKYEVNCAICVPRAGRSTNLPNQDEVFIRFHSPRTLR